MSQPIAALSVDFEFFSHLPAYRQASGTTDKQAVGLDGVVYLLDMLETAGVTGTFFTVSEIGDTHPEIIKDVADDGHEIGSHTHTHRHLSELSRADRQEELAISKNRLEALTGNDVVGFRAPSFDIADRHFEDLAKSGYRYDSSVVPCRSIPGWYGGEYSTQRPTLADTITSEGSQEQLSTIAEIPVGVMPILRLPLTGTWIRFFGVTYTILGMRLLSRKGIAPVLYIHPWELVELPSVRGVPSRVYVRTGQYMRRAVQKILEQPFEFISVGSLSDTVMSESDRNSMDTDPS